MGGISLEGMSTSVDSSRRIALRVGSPRKGRGSRDDEEGLEAAEGGNAGSLSSVELSDRGVRVSLEPQPVAYPPPAQTRNLSRMIPKKIPINDGYLARSLAPARSSQPWLLYRGCKKIQDA